MPEWSHLSGLNGAGRRQVMQGRETRPTAGAATGGAALKIAGTSKYTSWPILNLCVAIWSFHPARGW